MKTLKDRIDRDTMKYSNDLKKIQRAIDYQTHLKSFVNTICMGEDEELFKRKSEGKINCDDPGSIQTRNSGGRDQSRFTPRIRPVLIVFSVLSLDECAD